jgi:hypothetical protein
VIKFVEVWHREDDHGRNVAVFVCRHAPGASLGQRRVSAAESEERGWCASSTVGGRRFVCGKSAADRNPRSPDPEEGCPGGLKACTTCEDIVAQFVEKAFDAKAVREEFFGEGLN